MSLPIEGFLMALLLLTEGVAARMLEEELRTTTQKAPECTLESRKAASKWLLEG